MEADLLLWGLGAPHFSVSSPESRSYCAPGQAWLALSTRRGRPPGPGSQGVPPGADLRTFPMPSTRSCFSCGSQRCCRPSMRSWWLTCCAGLQRSRCSWRPRGLPDKPPAGHAPATGQPCLLPHPGEATETAAARATEALLFRLQTVLRAQNRRPFLPPEGLGPAELSGAGQAWKRAEALTGRALQQSSLQLERLETLARRFQRKAALRERLPNRHGAGAGRAAAPLASPAMVERPPRG